MVKHILKILRYEYQHEYELQHYGRKTSIQRRRRFEKVVFIDFEKMLCIYWDIVY